MRVVWCGNMEDRGSGKGKGIHGAEGKGLAGEGEGKINFGELGQGMKYQKGRLFEL